VLSSFEIKNFRTFSHLRIERLGRVNLIVGKNNVGKTALLEALRFYAMGSATALREYLVEHDELLVSPGLGEPHLDLCSLFHRRPTDSGEIEIGPLSERDKHLHVRLTRIERIEESDGGFHLQEIEEEDTEPEGEILAGAVLQRNDTRILVSPWPTQRLLRGGKYVGPAFVPARGVPESDLTQWWDALALTQSEDRVIECLSLMAPVERITTIADPLQRGGRVFRAKLQGESTPVSLRSLGGGSFRVFQLAAAIEYASYSLDRRGGSSSGEPPEEAWQRTDMLLVDEIENGIHYTLHMKLWRFIFRLAQRYNLQVFATSHSWDCLEGFQKALAADEQADALAIRLEKVEGEQQTGAVIIDRDDLPIVIRDSIEVR